MNTRPKVSVCINSAGEGPRLKSTISEFHNALGDYPHEFVIVDDASTDGSASELGEEVRVLRNETRIGCDRSKNRAMFAARAECLWFADGHHNLVSGSAIELIESAMDLQAIVCPIIRHIAYDQFWQPYVLSGQLLIPDPKALGLYSGFFESVRAEKLTNEIIPIDVPAMTFVVSRSTLIERLGGINNYEGAYGSQERGIGLRAFMADVPIRVLSSVQVGHEFNCKDSPSRNHFPYRPQSGISVAKNAWHAYAVVTIPETFDRYIRPALMSGHGWRAGAGTEQSLIVKSEQEHFHRFCKKRADWELVEKIGLYRQELRGLPLNDIGDHPLEPLAVEMVERYAHGRALEFGTGSAKGTRALLTKCLEVVTIDDDLSFVTKAQEEFKNKRVHCLCAQLGADGFYQLRLIGLFDTVLIDGPINYGSRNGARSNAMRAIWPHVKMGTVILVDDGKRDTAMVEQWLREYPLTGELLPTNRGMWKLLVTGEGNADLREELSDLASNVRSLSELFDLSGTPPPAVEIAED